MSSAAADFRARSLARRRSGVRFIRFSFRDLLEMSWREPQAATGGASPDPLALGQERPPRERPRQLAAAGFTPGHGATDQFLAAPDALLSVLTSVNRILAPMHPGYCPRCGERVTPYAAGCALCGADLDPKRWQKPVVRPSATVGSDARRLAPRHPWTRRGSGPGLVVANGSCSSCAAAAGESRVSVT